jgi:hypothetical protein
MWRYIEAYGVAHFVRVLCGWLFIVFGLLGLVLPILQGILFLAIGALLLAPYVPFFRRLKVLLYRRFPKVRGSVERIKRRSREKLRRHRTSPRA